MVSTPSVNLAALTPMLAVSIGAMLVLLIEVTLSKRESLLGRPVTQGLVGGILSLVSAASLAVAFGSAASAFLSGDILVFNPDHPMIRIDAFSAFAIALISVASFLVCWLSITYLAEVRINHGEYYALILLSTAGMMFLVAATDMMMLFKILF